MTTGPPANRAASSTPQARSAHTDPARPHPLVSFLTTLSLAGASPPLSLPPNFTLTPPTPGAPPPQSGSADQQAKAKILGRAPQNTATKPAPADLSAGESALYSALALGQATDDIRGVVDQETTGFVYEKRYLIDKILDWIEDRPPGIRVDAAKERRRLNQNKAEGKPVTDGETPRIERRPRNRLQKLF